MNKKYRFLALLLTLALSLSLLAGCGKTAQAEPEEQTPASAEQTQAAEEQTKAAEQTQQAAPDAAADQDGMEGSAPAAQEITYPLCDTPEELTFWTTFGESAYIDSYNDLFCLPYVTEQTGVRLVFQEVSSEAAATQFSLMIASGDWPDMIPSGNYTGGVSQAYTDEVIVDLTDLIPQYAPDYSEKLSEQTYSDQELVRTDGMLLHFSEIQTNYKRDRGLTTRADWLEELGLEAPATLETFTDTAYAMFETYGCDTAFLNSGPGADYLKNAFQSELPDYDVNNPTPSVSVFVDDEGNVTSCYVTDGARAYLEWFGQCFADGLISSDFYSSRVDPNDEASIIGGGKVAFWETGAERIQEYGAYGDDADWEAVALGTIFADDEAAAANQDTWSDETACTASNGTCITADCDDPGLACSFINYFFTDAGILLANYGVEGETFYYAEDGSPAFGDIIMNNPNGWNVTIASQMYTFNRVPFYKYYDRLWAAYDAEALNAISLWNSAEALTTHAYPNGAGLTTEESDSLTSYITDVAASAQESVLKFMTGAVVLDDDSWNAYLDELNALGMQNILDTYQNAYEEYLAGERFVVTSGGMGGGGGTPPDNGGAAPGEAGDPGAGGTPPDNGGAAPGEAGDPGAGQDAPAQPQ